VRDPAIHSRSRRLVPWVVSLSTHLQLGLWIAYPVLSLSKGMILAAILIAIVRNVAGQGNRVRSNQGATKSRIVVIFTVIRVVLNVVMVACAGGTDRRARVIWGLGSPGEGGVVHGALGRICGA
jgi:hypothetical protein